MNVGYLRRRWFSMLRKALVLALALAPGLAGPSVAVAAGTFFAEPPEIAGAPFSAVAKTESMTLFSDGNRIVRTNTVQYYRDGQGRTRIERGDGPNRVISISDPVSGERYIVRPENKTVIAYKVSAGGGVAPAMIPATASAMDDMVPFALLGFGMGIGANPTTEASSETTSLGEKTINGVAATGTRLVRTIPVDAIGNQKPITSTLDRWVSPDLGIPVQINQKSSLGGELTLTLEQVARAEPNPALFTPPSDYTRRDVNMPARVASVSAGPSVMTTTVTAVKKDP
jgi:hypothetical protein